jgi:TonB family protein
MDMSRDETPREVEQGEPTASAQEPPGPEFSDGVTARQARGEPTADIGPPTQSVTAEQAPAPARRDFGWVGLALRARVEERKRYSVEARLNGWEGRAVIAAEIVSDGRIIDSRIVESSGNPRLDEDARALVAGVSPLKLAQALEADRLTVKIPIVFGLR